MQLVATDLTISRGGREVIAGLSFKVAPGEGLLLTGPNGVGKTTLLRAVGGLLALTCGEIRLEGAPDADDVGPNCHYFGHLNAVKASLTVAENLTFWRDFLGGPSSGSAQSPLLPRGEGRGEGLSVNNSIAAALDRLGLADLEDLPAAYLSAGQKRRLGLARLLIAKRPLWLLDEPTVSLDADSQARLATLIGEHLTGGGLAVIATHAALGLSTLRELRLSRAAEAA